jgi:membrane-associated phospholipid phosphatase
MGRAPRQSNRPTIITNMTSRQMRSWLCALTLGVGPLCGVSVHAQDAVHAAALGDVLRELPPQPEHVREAVHRGLFEAPTASAAGDPAIRRPSAWRDLFTDTWADAKQFPSTDTLQWLAIGAAAAATVRPADKHVGPSIASITALSDPLQPGAVLGSTPLQLGLSALTYSIGRSTGSPRMVAAGADLFRAQLLAQALTMGMKASFRRERPEGAGFAFPSGHTTVSFASATVLQRHFGWGAGIPAYALASYVALSRVQMKRHYLSDVAFGAALGIAAGRSVTIGRTHKVAIAPMLAPGGGGVQFTLVR